MDMFFFQYTILGSSLLHARRCNLHAEFVRIENISTCTGPTHILVMLVHIRTVRRPFLDFELLTGSAERG
jgi:hypothetical protein